MILIPPNRQWVSSGQSDIKGSLWSSFNLDLTQKEGTTLVSPRTIITTNDITDLGVPVGFVTFTDVNGGVQYCWCVAGGYVFRMNLSAGYQTAFAKDAAAGTPNNNCSSDVSDIVISGKDWMVVTSANDVYLFNPSNGQWNDGANELGTGVHMTCFYAGRFYFIASAGLKIYSCTPANYAALTTSSSNSFNVANKGYDITTLTFLRPTSNRIWIGSLNQSENGCWIFAWDGATANDPNESYFIPDASGILASVIKNDVPWIMDNNGRLMYFNGGSFVEAPKGKLPVKNHKFLKNPLSASNDRWIHPNGMQIVNGRVNILINNEHEDNGATIEENIASGLWEYDEQVGWYHKMSLSLYTSSITDFGQNRVSRVGAIYANKTESTDASANGTILLGAQVYTDSSSTAENIYTNDSNDTLQKYGYFVTTKIFSDNIADVFQKVIARFKKFLNSNDSIAIKYRDDDPVSTEITITWTSATTFTHGSDLTAYVGYEVEGLQGKGSGKCAHISSVSYSGGTSTVTVDDSFTGATSGTAKVRIQNWKKAGLYNLRTDKFYSFSLLEDNKSTWIQLKVCMLFTGANELDDIIVINKPHQLAQ